MTANTEPMVLTLSELYQYMNGRTAQRDGRPPQMGWTPAQIKGYADAKAGLVPVYSGRGSQVFATLGVLP